jgi:hypothetical protein
MKGITLIGDLFLLIGLLSITVIMTLFINVLIVTFQVENRLLPGGMPTTRSVELKLLIKPVNYDTTLSAFLENEYEGIKIKKILNAVAIQGKTTVWLEGKTIDAATISKNILTSQIKRNFLLKVGDITVTSYGQLSSTDSVLGVQKISTYTFSLNGETINVQLLVVD